MCELFKQLTTVKDSGFVKHERIPIVLEIQVRLECNTRDCTLLCTLTQPRRNAINFGALYISGGKMYSINKIMAHHIREF